MSHSGPPTAHEPTAGHSTAAAGTTRAQNRSTAHAVAPGPPRQEPLIELANVSRQFGRQLVLRDVTLPVYRGETLVIIGESGCGKSVTTKLIAGLLDPSRGHVYWEGRTLHERSAREIEHDRLKLGYLFQGAALFDSLSVYDNVAFGLTQAGHPRSDTLRQTVIDRLRDVGLAEVVCSKRPAELSGGMRKRVALARALALSPEIMIYDEPTTGLDPIMSDVINELILRTAATKQVTSIVVTHDMTTVKRVADRVVMLCPVSRLAANEPQVIFEGTAEGAFESPDNRVRDFVQGNAGARLQELAA